MLPFLLGLSHSLRAQTDRSHRRYNRALRFDSAQDQEARLASLEPPRRFPRPLPRATFNPTVLRRMDTNHTPGAADYLWRSG